MVVVPSKLNNYHAITSAVREELATSCKQKTSQQFALSLSAHLLSLVKWWPARVSHFPFSLVMQQSNHRKSPWNQVCHSVCPPSMQSSNSCRPSFLLRKSRT